MKKAEELKLTCKKNIKIKKKARLTRTKRGRKSWFPRSF